MSGYLDRNEFQKFLTRIGVFLSTQELTAVFNAFDINGDGRINYLEFVQTIRVIHNPTS